MDDNLILLPGIQAPAEEQVPGVPPHGFSRCPSERPFGSAVPVANAVFQVLNDNGVRRLIEESRLFAKTFVERLKVVFKTLLGEEAPLRSTANESPSEQRP